MNGSNLSINKDCSKNQIAAHYDGDLTPVEESIVESHLKDCPKCAEYLNSLKMVSTSLEIFLDREPPPLPGEFSKRVTAAAESSVDGLRSNKERSKAVMIVAVLVCLAAVAVSTDAAGVQPVIGKFSGQIVAFGVMIGHIFYTVSLGVSAIVGAFCSKTIFSSSIVAFGVLTILTISILVFSKHITRFNRS